MLCLSSGCNDAPDSVGGPTLSKEDYGTVQIKPINTIVEQPTQTTLLFTGSIDRMMLGKYQATQNQTYEAWTCLKFYNWPDSLLGVAIRSAQIRLKPFYNFGDSLSSFFVNVYRAKASILRDSITFDSLNLNGNYYYDSNHPMTIQANDSLINLDAAVVSEWFISNTDTTNRNDGVLLRPMNGNVIKGFYSCNVSDTALQPTLYITYVDTNGITGTGTYTHKIGISRYVAHVDPALFENNSDGKMRVQDGISYRGLLDLNNYSFDSLALLWPFSINQAVLQITLDSASSSCRFTPFANNLLYGLSVGTDNKAIGAYSAPSEQLSDSTGRHFYQFNISSMVPAWIHNTIARKITFSGYPESGSFDLFTFYGAGSTMALRPKIIIKYSLKR